jgi:O-antigen ligase
LQLHSAEGRADWPSLFVSGAALLLLVASLLTDDAYRWGAIVLLALACMPRFELSANAVSGVVALFCGWLFLNALLLTPGYRAEGLYRPLILFGAFASFSAIGRNAGLRLFRSGVALLAILVLVGLLQHWIGFWRLSHNALRAAATFVTPNSFATAINLFLLPLAALYLTGNRSPRVYGLILWLFAGLVATQSRGGMLALFAGLLFVAVCVGWSGLRQAGRPIARLLVGGAAVWILVVAVARLLVPLMDAGGLPSLDHGFWGGLPSLDPWLGRVTWDRAEIYATTLRLILERPIAGAGANMFWPLFEPLKPAIFGDHTFTFAHNDYLQIWLEYGALGLALLLALGATSLAFARSTYRRTPGDPVPLACGAALASCFAHAVVDFPFYVPFILFVAGGYLGALASGAGDSLKGGAWRWSLGYISRLVTPRVRWLAVLALIAWIGQPMLAQLATGRALEVLVAGNVEGGLYWQSVARRLEPRNPSHYWTEAVIWRELAAESGDRAYWAKADALLADGIRANPPFSFLLRLERARLHRRFSQNLDHAATPVEVLAWVEEALAGAPGSFEGQVERARALAYAGRREEATRISRGLLERRPESPLARRLAEEMR